ncbi:MAG: D-Ala-D-Ala carboxypeptidase family metallohydrolase, partial [Bdellovibrionota bacterium]
MKQKIFLLAALLITTPIASQARAEWGNDNIVKDTKDRTNCTPKRVQEVLKAVQAKFKKVIIKSGFRDVADNARRGGAKGSQHLKCGAIDFLIPGRESRNTQQQLATFLQQ